MALKKVKVLDSGVTGEYWKVSKVSVKDKKELQATLSLYTSKEASDEGKKDLGEKVIFKVDITPSQAVSNLIEVAYVKVKELAALELNIVNAKHAKIINNLKDAEDC